MPHKSGNLRAVEKTLDAFFRDTKDIEGLALVNKLMAQTSGALSLLGHSAASQGAQSIAIDVAQFQPGKNPDANVAARIAESLSALSFFVESIGNADMQAIGSEFVTERSRPLRKPWLLRLQKWSVFLLRRP
jgi:hypothetical protein